MQPSPTHCPFCQETRLQPHQVQSSEGRIYTILECLLCEAGWQWPLLRDTETSVHYFKELYGQGIDYADPREVEKRAELQVLALPKTKGDLLDIGAGTGGFIRVAAKHGWNALGLEPAGQPFKEPNAELVAGTLNDLPKDRRFDAITLLDVVEHVPNYHDIVVHAKGHLKPKGTLVIETGNYQSIDRLRGGKTWWDYQEDHRWYLSPNVLIRQLIELGFQRPRLSEVTPRVQWKREHHEPLSGLAALKHPIQAMKEHARVNNGWDGWYFLPIFIITAERNASG